MSGPAFGRNTSIKALNIYDDHVSGEHSKDIDEKLRSDMLWESNTVVFFFSFENIKINYLKYPELYSLSGLQTTGNFNSV